jgi:hypothetical protein
MINDGKLQEKIGFFPHEAQKKILSCEEKEVVVCAGRRFGKSAICAYIAIRTIVNAIQEKKPVKVWIVSPTYELSQRVFEYIIKWFIRVIPSQKAGITSRPFPMIRTADGSIIQCKSAENPSSLLGEELDLLIVDEAARLKKEIWESYLFATVQGRSGKTIFISTPMGKNWFWEQFEKCKETNSAFRFSSLEGKSITQEKWDHIKKSVPADIFEREYMATFQEGANSVFRNIHECISTDYPKKPISGHRYSMGLDLAKFNDFTVMTVLDKMTNQVVFHDRFNKIPYPLQLDRITSTAKEYGATVIIDSLNVGAAIGDELRAREVSVWDFKTTGTISKDWDKKGSKERLVEKLALFLEQRIVRIPPLDVLIDELESYGYDITDSGNIRYGAPEGFHDDCVMSLALAIWQQQGKEKQELTQVAEAMPQKKKRFQYF